MDLQLTIKKPVASEGVGLHSGLPVRMILHPAPPDSGIIFRLLHYNGATVTVSPESLVDHFYATTIGFNGSIVRTVEHLLSAAAALGIDNLLVELNAGEVPALDGSARPFCALLYAAGKETQPVARRPLVVTEPIRVGDAERWIQVLPSETFRVSYTLDLPHPAVGTQVASFPCTEQVFVEELAGARTYGFLKDLEFMRQQGLARGGSLENAVLVGSRGIVNGSLRYKDEFVRHKILDLIGDLKVLGRPVLGHVVARNGGHSLNHALVLELHRVANQSGLPDKPVARALHRAVERVEAGAHILSEGATL